MKKFSFYTLFIAFFLVNACKENNSKKEETNPAEEQIAEVKREYAPDKRVALFEVEAEKNEGGYLLKGETNMPEAKADLKNKLKAAKINFVDSIQILPAKNLNDSIYGIIDNSVANLRGDSKHSSELVTQAILGTPVKIFKRTAEWFYVQTPDGYLSWVDHGGISTMDESRFKNWKKSKKVIYTRAFGQSYSKNSLDSNPVSDLVTGAILELEAEQKDFYKVLYPDGRKAYIDKNDAQIYSEWLKNLNTSEDNLVATSKELMGLPYLWGGTSSKGVDCSGFTKTVYFMNGLVIPRDASQQVKVGKTVDSTKNFKNLKPGDLLFFGTPATDSTTERIVHVGMWIGNNEFIHASGDVHISSVDEKEKNFDEFNRNRYIRTKRYVNEQGKQMKYLKDQKIYSDSIFN